jgi:hypothetical protein
MRGRVPDWRLVDPSGDDDEISPPLTFAQLIQPLQQATEGSEPSIRVPIGSLKGPEITNLRCR